MTVITTTEDRFPSLADAARAHAFADPYDALAWAALLFGELTRPDQDGARTPAEVTLFAAARSFLAESNMLDRLDELEDERRGSH